MRVLLVLLVGVACRQTPPGPELLGDVEVAPLDDQLPLQRTVSFTTNEPATVTWTLTANDHVVEQSLPRGKDHEAVLVGLRPDRAYASALHLEGPSGARTLLGPEVASGSLPDDFPDLDVLAWTPEEVEPGVTLINLTVPLSPTEEVTHVVLLDETLEPVWYLRSEESIGYARWEEGLWGISGGVGVHWSVAGVVDQRLVPRAHPEPTTELDVSLDVDWTLHYDILPTGRDSFFTLLYDSFEVADYPLGSDEPDVVPNPQTLRDMVAVELGFDGVLRNRWPLSERLDPGRISYSSHNASPDGLDWAHSNAVAHGPDGGVLISSRHQDAVVALDDAGDVQWILSNPDGWREPWSQLRLQPVGDVQWPSHQHAPHLGDDGVLVLFDNGNHRSTPYDPVSEEEELYTRVAGYRVDGEAMTVEQAFSFEETVTGRLYSSALGDADPQPVTGNVIGTFSMLDEEGGVANVDLGRGRLAVRLIEFVPATLETVLDVRFSTDVEMLWRGVRSFRSERVPTDALPWSAQTL